MRVDLPAVSVIVPGHAAWPGSLVGLPGAPLLLYAQGNLERLRAPMVALVGARSCTGEGRGMARRLSAAVAEAGGVVVSGLAAGIDAEAHLAARGRTVAVLGQGLGAPMARWQRDLRSRVLDAGGLVLSEYEGDTAAAAWTFPRRNRIIAGLARAVVVVEAARRSGSKNTAAHALAYGRDVYAVPWSPGLPTAEGCLDLIEQGAGVVRGADTVAALLGSPPG